MSYHVWYWNSVWISVFVGTMQALGFVQICDSHRSLCWFDVEWPFLYRGRVFVWYMEEISLIERSPFILCAKKWVGVTADKVLTKLHFFASPACSWWWIHVSFCLQVALKLDQYPFLCHREHLVTFPPPPLLCLWYCCLFVGWVFQDWPLRKTEQPKCQR